MFFTRFGVRQARSSSSKQHLQVFTTTMGLLDLFKPKQHEHSKHEMHNELLKYIQQRKFDLVFKFLLADQDYGRAAIRSFSSSEAGNILHLLLCYQPPQELVALTVHLMVTKNSDELVPEDTRNSRGETPLHVAVQHNCDASIVELLTRGMAGTLPAVTKDEQLRYPLHWACANPTGVNPIVNKQHVPSASDVLNMVKSITFLSKIEPMSVEVKDVNGQTPIEIARQHGADDKIILALENAAAKAFRRSNHETDHSEDTKHGYPPTIQYADTQDDLSSVSWLEVAKNDESNIFEWERTFKRECGLDDLDDPSDDDESSSIRSGVAVNLVQI